MMNFKQMRECVVAQKKARTERCTPYTDYGRFAICIASNGEPFIVDSDIAPQICHRSWCNSQGYLATRVNDDIVRLHEFVMSTCVEEKPQGYYVDHVNQDKYDNRRTNLRLVAPTENSKNLPLRSNNKSGYIGVCKATDGKKYRAYITKNGKQKNLGLYDTAEEAYEARKEAEARLGYLTRYHSHKPDIKTLCEL